MARYRARVRGSSPPSASLLAMWSHALGPVAQTEKESVNCANWKHRMVPPSAIDRDGMHFIHRPLPRSGGYSPLGNVLPWSTDALHFLTSVQLALGEHLPL